MQIPYLARHARVVTFDGRGNGRSDRPEGVEPYLEDEFAADTLAVMDATGTERAILVGCSCGALWATIVAADHPERVDGLVCIAPAVGLAPGSSGAAGLRLRRGARHRRRLGEVQQPLLVADYRELPRVLLRAVLNEPHSTKQIEDCVGWALETTPEVLADTTRAISLCRTEQFARHVPPGPLPGARHPRRRGPRSARTRRARRSPRRPAGRSSRSRARGTCRRRATRCKVNLLLRDFVCPPVRRHGAGPRGRSRRRRALYVSSPIGLGHARRDLAIADELRRLAPRPRDRLARPAPGHRGPRGARRAHPPGERRAWPASPATSSPSRPSTTCTCFQALAADGRDPRRQLHGLPRRRPRRALRPLDRRRGLGARLLPAREPRAEDARRTPG